jgi:hypothetical protein
MPGLRELVFGVLCKHPRAGDGHTDTRWNPSRHTQKIRKLSDASSLSGRCQTKSWPKFHSLLTNSRDPRAPKLLMDLEIGLETLTGFALVRQR